MNILNTGINCPSCRKEVIVMSGLVPDQVYFAIRRQQYGVFIECETCKHRFTWMGTEEQHHAATSPVSQPLAVPAHSPLSRPATNPAFEPSPALMPSVVGPVTARAVAAPPATATPAVAPPSPVVSASLTTTYPVLPTVPFETVTSSNQTPATDVVAEPSPPKTPIQTPHFINRQESRERESLPAWHDMDEFSR